MNSKKQLLIIIVSFCNANLGTAKRKVYHQRNITDSETGEDLIGATVIVEEPRTGATTNVYGLYSLTLPKRFVWKITR